MRLSSSIIILIIAFFYPKQGRSDLLSYCILKTVQNISETQNDFVYVLHSNITVQDEFILTFVSNQSRPIVIANEILNPFNSFSQLAPTAYLIYALDDHHFYSLFANVNSTHQNWHPSSKFIICIRRALANEIELVRSISQLMAKTNVFLFDVLVLNRKQTVVNIYTWSAFADANQCGRFFNITLVDSCTSEGFVLKTDLWPQKIPRTQLPAEGCIFKVCAFHWPPYVYQDKAKPQPVRFIDGIHVQTMSAFARKYHLQIQYVPSEESARWGSLQDNGTWTGALGHLQRGNAQAALGGALQTVLRFSAFDCSTTFKILFMKFYQTRPAKLPHWKNMIEIFTPIFWIVISLMYVGISIFMGVLSRWSILNEKNHFKNFANCFLTLWRAAVGNSAFCVPRSPMVRVIFLLWLIYNVHVTLVYSSSLLGVITTPSYAQPIKTINELQRTNLKIKVVKQFVQISNMMDHELKGIITKKFTPVSVNFTHDIERMITKKDVVIFDPSDHFEILAREKLSQIYIMNDFLRLNTGIYMKRGSVFLPFLDLTQLAVLESGLLLKWENDLTGLDKYRKLKRVKYENEVLPLTRQELSGSFYVLIFGLSLSVLIFFVEFCFSKHITSFYVQ